MLTNAVKGGHEVLIPQVFISYAKENETVADLIYDTLNAGAIPCWVAHRDIAAGQDWLDEISKAISNSRVIIVVLSDFTEKSRYVKKEVRQAVDENLRIIPFCIEEVSLTTGLKLLLNDSQWINAYLMHQDKALDRLVEDLRRYLGIEPGKTLKKEEPDFIGNLKTKGWDVKKNESDYWEAYYKVYDITMIHIPSGKFIMGTDDGADNEKPPHEVELDGYWIGKYEVTFAQYDRYCRETGKEKPNDEGWGRENRPVINVSWDDAVAYCRWLSQKSGLRFQLPTEAQWEKAARGSRGFQYPWGNDFDIN
ncbi:MAG TPA: SUMF1/EgtB/PvdO family nonheme iron enzyme, partial [Candidatus Deferrimicrobium sp.]|nr:SUMF1/EgtB/PvdO family nonheme iron enzyme [Candidatus Deferrimicrobium sp.]